MTGLLPLGFFGIYLQIIGKTCSKPGRLSRTAWERLRISSFARLVKIASLAGRMKISERDVATVKKSQTSGEKKIEKLAEDVANLQVQFQDVQAKVTEFQTDKVENRDDGGGVGLDPWGAYLRKNRRWPPPVGPPGMSSAGMPSAGIPSGLPSAPSNETSDQLSEEDRRTLIIGGWLQDTRRATIEEESAKLLQHGEIKPLIDAEKLAVYGPRRSVGMLKFVQRPGEHGDDIKSRMWKVVKKVAELKMQVESSKAMGEDRTMWAAFVKTKSRQDPIGTHKHGSTCGHGISR